MAWPMVAGAVAGITSKLVVLPLDMVKKRVQTEVRIFAGTERGRNERFLWG